MTRVPMRPRQIELGPMPRHRSVTLSMAGLAVGGALMAALVARGAGAGALVPALRATHESVAVGIAPAQAPRTAPLPVDDAEPPGNDVAERPGPRPLEPLADDEKARMLSRMRDAIDRGDVAAQRASGVAPDLGDEAREANRRGRPTGRRGWR